MVRADHEAVPLVGHDPHGVQGKAPLQSILPEVRDGVTPHHDAAIGRKQQRLLAIECGELLRIALVRGLLIHLHEFGQFTARIRDFGPSGSPAAGADGQDCQQHHHGTRDCHSGRSLGSFSDVEVALP